MACFEIHISLNHYIKIIFVDEIGRSCASDHHFTVGPSCVIYWNQVKLPYTRLLQNMLFFHVLSLGILRKFVALLKNFGFLHVKCLEISGEDKVHS